MLMMSGSPSYWAATVPSYVPGGVFAGIVKLLVMLFERPGAMARMPVRCSPVGETIANASGLRLDVPSANVVMRPVIVMTSPGLS
jgi:hypothetical protein